LPAAAARAAADPHRPDGAHDLARGHRALEGPEAPRLDLRRPDDGLRFHAGDGAGRRPHRRLLGAMIAVVRGVPASFDRALASAPVAIDVARARAQHADYVAALAALGAEIVEVPADDAAPDCCFIEDTCVVAGGRALVTIPGAPSRRGEVDP